MMILLGLPQSQVLLGFKGVGHVTFNQSGADCQLTGSALAGGDGSISIPNS